MSLLLDVIKAAAVLAAAGILGHWPPGHSGYLHCVSVAGSGVVAESVKGKKSRKKIFKPIRR